MAAETLEAGFYACSNVFRSPSPDRPGRILAVALGLLEDGRRQIAGHLVDVVAVVAVFWDFAAVADRHNGGAEVLDLAAEIVEVILPSDLVSGGGEDAAQQIAGECAASVADVERTRRVGRYELDVDALGVLGGDMAPGRGRSEGVPDRRGERGVGKAHVQETWRRDLDRGDRRSGVCGGGRDFRGDCVGDLERRASQRLCELQRDGAGEIAACRVGRTLDVNGDLSAFGERWQRAGFLGLAPGSFDGAANLGPETGGGVGGHARMVARATPGRGAGVGAAR